MNVQMLADYISVQLPRAWENCYEPAMARYRPDWLDDYDFEYILDYYGFEERYYKPRLRQEVALLKQDATLNRICWLMHYILFYGEKADVLSVWRWKGTPEAFLEHGSYTTCVVAQLTGQPIHQKNMAERGYDQEQIAIHKASVRGVWEEQHETFGLDGMDFGRMVWGTYYMHCYLVRLGRLQYETGLKHYSAYDDRFGGDPVYIYIHIPPADNGLQSADIDASLQLAEQRLEEYFPHIKGKQRVFCTSTWLLSPELKEILKPTSNIIQFQNRFTVTEFTETVVPFLGFAFGVRAVNADYTKLPEDTHLRRELKKRLLNGQALHTGWGYFTL